MLINSVITIDEHIDYNKNSVSIYTLFIERDRIIENIRSKKYDDNRIVLVEIRDRGKLYRLSTLHIIPNRMEGIDNMNSVLGYKYNSEDGTTLSKQISNFVYNDKKTHYTSMSGKIEKNIIFRGINFNDKQTSYFEMLAKSPTLITFENLEIVPLQITIEEDAVLPNVYNLRIVSAL